MEAPYPLKMVRDWRIQTGDPEGLTMWFDLSFEVPLLGILPPEQRDDDAGSAEFQMRMELTEVQGVGPLEGGAARVSDEGLECPEGPPQDFLDSLWEGDIDGS